MDCGRGGLVLGTTLNCLHDDLRLPQRRRGIITKKTDSYDSFSSTETQPPRWLAVRICVQAMIQDHHFNLVSYTLIQTSLQYRRLTVSLFGGWYWYEMADGNSRWTPSLYRLFTLLGAVDIRWRNPPVEAGLRTSSTTNIRGNRGACYLVGGVVLVLSCPWQYASSGGPS